MSLAPRGRSATPPDVLVARRAAKQHGRIRFDQLVACGLDDAAAARRVHNGQLHRVHVGVYAVGHPGETLCATFMAAVLAGGDDAFLSRWACCALAGLVRWDDRNVDVTIRGVSHRNRPGIRFHRARSLHPHDTTKLKRLIRKAQAEKTLARSPPCCAVPAATAPRSGSPTSSPAAPRRPRARTRTSC
ncbi:MAG: type IV toxin-antitoxin system AbiEi family antitoxin domain-containing protein, partial [Solirubrobacteraceae bacterium]|nr:type IV toxin-antitoxin system AbiEi family antitoxin domain-containing protein [Solirubrobacteraceae bacterium]